MGPPPSQQQAQNVAAHGSKERGDSANSKRSSRSSKPPGNGPVASKTTKAEDDQEDVTSERGHVSSRVRVITRLRPCNENEKARGDVDVILTDTGQAKELKVLTSTNAGREVLKPFSFDWCAAPSVSQEEFFSYSGVKDLILAALDGYNATVFAYGQTGSGKTYSMSGLEEKLGDESRSKGQNEDSDGIIPRAMRFIFDSVQSLQEGGVVKYSIRASYCEIYNEQVYDLLNFTQQPLGIRWGQQTGFFVKDLVVVSCENLDDLMAVVAEGHKNRRVGSHNLNKDSSRSHSLLALYLDSESIDKDDGHLVQKYGKITFVDLAGSERIKDTKPTDLQETGSINKSLFTLGKVISFLADSKANKNHVPYRDSKLTKLLMDSLGGNSQTLMVACCSPASSMLEETLSTLNYATRAKNIQNQPSVHVNPQEQLIIALRKANRLLKLENEYLRSQIGGGKPLLMHGVPMGQEIRQPDYPPPELCKDKEPQKVHRVPPLDETSGKGEEQRPLSTHSDDANNLVRLRKATTAKKGQEPIPATERGRKDSTGIEQEVQAEEAEATDFKRLLHQYQLELERIKKENGDLRVAVSSSDGQMREILTENEALRQKLDNLEEAFFKTGDSSWTIGESSSEKKTKESVENAGLRAEVEKLKNLNFCLEKKLEETERRRSTLLLEKNTLPSNAEFQALKAGNSELKAEVARLKQRESQLLKALDGTD